MRLATSIAAAIVLMVAAPAQAQMYWRADLGHSRPGNGDFKDKDFNAAGNIVANASTFEPATLNHIDGSSVFGGGVGYRLAANLRAEVMLAYRGSFRLNDRTFEADYHANVKSTALMLNGYHDFAAGGISPYVGLGIGLAHNKTDRLIQDFRLGFANTFIGATKNDAAFALMAGIGIAFPGWTLDIGYRYADLGRFETGNVAAFGVTSGHRGKLAAHELTLGVRF